MNGKKVQDSRVVLFETADKRISFDVRFDKDSAWLTRPQIAELFCRDKTVIARHIQNAYREGELDPESTSAKFALVQFEGGREVSRIIEHYSLDVIISVGYRVKSQYGTQFRIWATQTLRQHLSQGYTLHKPRLSELGLDEIRETIEQLSLTSQKPRLVHETNPAVEELIGGYALAWRWLLNYDEEQLTLPSGTNSANSAIDYSQILKIIEVFRCDLMARGEASSVFGIERSNALKSILGNIEQTMFSKTLYRSLEEKAAHLLYFVIKDHPFVDGNKRIAALLFLVYLEKENVSHRIGPGTLTVLTLLIAQSPPCSKNQMIYLVVNLLKH